MFIVLSYLDIAHCCVVLNLDNTHICVVLEFRLIISVLLLFCCALFRSLMLLIAVLCFI